MAVTEKDLTMNTIEEIKMEDIKCNCENKEEVLEAINNAIRKVNYNIAPLTVNGEETAIEMKSILEQLSDKLEKKYPDMNQIFMKAEADIKYEMLKILTPYANEMLEAFEAQIKTWISSSSKGVTPKTINDAVKYCEKIQKGRIYECVKTLEDKSDELMNQIIGTYQKDFDKIINRKLNQVQTRLKNEIQPLQNWVQVWDPRGSFSNILDALKKLLTITSSGKGVLSKQQITSIDDLFEECCKKSGNSRGHLKNISKNTPEIKEITDQETKRIVMSCMIMVTEKSTEDKNFTRTYIIRKFYYAIRSNLKLLENLKKQLISVAKKSKIDLAVANDLPDAITKLINIISPQPMKGKLDQNDITLIKQLILCTYTTYKFTDQIPEIDLPCVKDIPTKCFMLDIIKLVENGKLSLSASNLNLIVVNYLNRLNNSNSKVIKHAKEMKFVTKKDLKIGIFNMPSTKKKLAEEINRQIERFDKFIKKQKSEIIKQRDNKIENSLVLKEYLDKYKGNPMLKKVEDIEFKRFAKNMQQHISRLKNVFKTKYINKWTRSKKDFETDCVINNDVCKWEQDLINDFKPTFVDSFINDLGQALQQSADKIKEIDDYTKDYKQKIETMIKKQKSKTIEKINNKINGLYDKCIGDATFEQIRNLELGKLDGYFKPYIPQLEKDFQDRYLKKWIKDNGTFEADCEVVKDDLCKWGIDLIETFEPNLIDQFVDNFKVKVKKAAEDELTSMAKDVNTKIKNNKEIYLGMCDLLVNNDIRSTWYNKEKKDLILDFVNWIEALTKSNFEVIPYLFLKSSSKQQIICRLLSGNYNQKVVTLYDENTTPNERLAFLNSIYTQKGESTDAGEAIGTMIALLSAPDPTTEEDDIFKRDCRNMTKNLSMDLEKIKNNEAVCKTWENYKGNKMFKTSFEKLIRILKDDKQILPGPINVINCFINDGFEVKNDYDVPKFISESWHDKNTRKVILGMMQLYSKEPLGNKQARLKNLAKNIDANAERNRKELEKFLGIDKSETQEEQEQPQKQPNPNKSTTQKPKQAPAANTKNKGSGTFRPSTNTPATARKRRKR